MPASRSGLRVARRWKTKASISIPAPAMVQAIRAPATPVSTPKRRGSRNTPEPIIDPMTMAVRVGRLTLLSLTSTSAAVMAPHRPPQDLVAEADATASGLVRLANGACSQIGDDLLTLGGVLVLGDHPGRTQGLQFLQPLRGAGFGDRWRVHPDRWGHIRGGGRDRRRCLLGRGAADHRLHLRPRPRVVAQVDHAVHADAVGLEYL